ncbi:BQ2448_1924 [Microbotryum intermedium]|uniref:Argininosuccinate synthase n=1 Tax=Microbotryum intermedium TaxID=269621 RepID=A0A238F9M0_9BASI|nr:BQ2448_1924 [Microbotryum intermedium]
MVAKGSAGRVLLAYSGGLDTSIILAWLIEQGYDVVAFMADVGQEEDFEAAEKKAYKIGADKFVLADVKREFVEHLVFPSVQANCIYEGVYLLGTSLARPVIARAMMDVVVEENFVAHGCTGKGNDQVRFELAFYALQPSIKVIAPWRDPEFYNRFAGRAALLEYAKEKGIPVFQTAAKPWSTGEWRKRTTIIASIHENLFHISYEAGILEDPDTTPPSDMWKLIKSLQDAPKEPERISITFTKGVPSSLLIHPAGTEAVPSIEGKKINDSVEIFLTLNALARKHGIGRIDIVENRFIGVKSRGCYESPGATILRKAHMDLEGLVLDRNVRALRDSFVTAELSKILYNGYWFSPEREFVQSCLEKSQESVNGRVRLSLIQGNVIIEGRKSDTEALYDAKQSSMDELGGFSPTDTTGFIAIESIRLKKWGEARLAHGATVKPESVYATAK